MEETVAFLRTETLFGVLDDQDLHDVARLAGRRHVDRGQMLGIAGGRCESVYFVIRGRILAFKTSPEGREQVINEVWPPDPFYLTPALDGQPLPVSTQAATRATVLVFSSSDFLQLLDRYPALCRALATYLARRLRRLSDLVGELSLQSVPERLARFLMDSARSATAYRYTQSEMAAHLGTVREVVSRTLADFQAKGWLQVDRGRIRILDPRALRSLADR